MHLVTGELMDVELVDGGRVGRLRVGGALFRVSLALVPACRVGDHLLAHAGVALARCASEPMPGHAPTLDSGADRDRAPVEEAGVPRDPG